MNFHSLTMYVQPDDFTSYRICIDSAPVESLVVHDHVPDL